MPGERREPPTLLSPLEWRVLLRHAANEQLDTDAIARWLQDDDHTHVDEATDSTLRALMGRRAGPAHGRH